MSVQAVQLSPRRTRNGSRHSLRVALVAMPFSEINRPSIQVGILQAVALEAGFQTDTFHLYLDMAAMIGVDTYEIISRLARAAIGDWIFSPAAFGDEAPDPDGTAFRPSRAAINILQDGLGQDWRDILCKVRADIPKYLDEVMASVQWADYPVVGFSSTFQQGVASLALARRLKEARPGTVIIFGGSNVEGPMGAEFVRVFDCVDCVVNGEAELVLPAVLEAVESGASLESIPGVATRTQPTAERQVVEDLNISPAPMYEEYFERARRLNLAEISRPGFVDLPFETARGCWWGERRHCTFCGLNGGGMAFRSKSPDRAAADIAELRQRYRSFRLSAVDNILDKDYLDAVFSSPKLGEGDLSIFYEVKADLGRAEIELLVNAGVDRAQPGIESLSSHVLHLMRKGTRASTNINFLKWTRFYGIQANWNLLYGFPGETAKDYQDQVRLMPSLHHLKPPFSVGRIMMDRFSPLFDDRASFPAGRVAPASMYAQIYPATCRLEELAYYFDYELDAEFPVEEYPRLYQAARDWHDAWRRAVPPTLTYRWMPGYATIHDRRLKGQSQQTVLEGQEADAYEYCSDGPQSLDAVRTRFPDIDERIEALVESGLMMRDGNMLLSLALPGHPRARHRTGASKEGGR